MPCAASGSTEPQTWLMLAEESSVASWPGTYPLMYSDNPEHIDSTVMPPTPVVLCTHTIDDLIGYWNLTGGHYVYCWHENVTGGDISIGVTIENTGSAPLPITYYYTDCPTGGASLAKGRGIAHDLIAQSFATGPIYATIEPANIAKLMSDTVGSGALFGLQMKILIPPLMPYRLRSVACTGRDPTPLLTSNLEMACLQTSNGQIQPRGAWPYSAIQVGGTSGNTPLYDAVPVAFTEAMSSNIESCPCWPMWKANPGCFGAWVQATMPAPSCPQRGFVFGGDGAKKDFTAGAVNAIQGLSPTGLTVTGDMSTWHEGSVNWANATPVGSTGTSAAPVVINWAIAGDGQTPVAFRFGP